ncbi:MAG: BatA domain-containing protein [Verrucomicrobiales bacterium]|nr:BatA domain-containing protein [Verrucomicrobiales bacterium]
MSFLFPLYLLGATAIAVPILLHLRRRPPKEHVEFGSLMFLEKTPERVTRRTQLEQLFLLALRCLAILLLAFAFGRPFLESVRLPSEDSSLTRAVNLVDRSA